MVGIFSWYGIPLPFAERIGAIKAAGFDSTSIWIGGEEALWSRDPGAMPAIVRESGLFLEYAHAPYGDANDFWDEAKSPGLEARMRGYIDYCAEQGIGTLVMHLTKGYRIKEANAHGIAVLRRLAARAAERGVRVALENTKQNGVLDSVFLAIPDGSLGLCFDSSHDNLYSGQKFAMMERYHERLLCLHLSDNAGRADDHWLPLEGAIDWAAFVKRFPRDYRGVINLEIVPKDQSDAQDDFLGRAYRIARELESRIAANGEA
jgi:sugar phosphate isomerase/epimerase